MCKCWWWLNANNCPCRKPAPENRRLGTLFSGATNCRLYVYVFELVRDEQTSLDLVQETFIAAVRHIGGLRDDGKFGSWLFGIAHQKCIQRWRKQNREEILLEEIAESPDEFEDGPDDLLIRREQEAEFMKLLNQLPLPQRSVLLLHFVEDFSLEEIARITGAQTGHGEIPVALRQKIAAKIAGGEEMKTPREILLERHRAAEPKLDAVRQSVVAAVCDRRISTHQDQARRSQTAATMIWHVFWRELIWPCRHIWAGLATAWVVILAVNFSIQDKSELAAEKSPPTTPEMIMTWRQQERLLAELIGPNEMRAATPPKTFSPRPSSERRFEILTT